MEAAAVRHRLRQCGVAGVSTALMVAFSFVVPLASAAPPLATSFHACIEKTGNAQTFRDLKLRVGPCSRREELVTWPAGTEGAVGPAGPQGAPGPQGPAGPVGSAGSPGAQGTRGVTGAAGSRGPSGSAGAQGQAGPQGVTGLQGPRGVTGVQGVTGAAGARGATGPQGIQGPVGATGPQGPRGVTGAHGVTGATGARGATGPQGIQGPVGVTGLQGQQGVTGVNGVTGATGARGSTGLQGAQGPTGPRGLTGPLGPTGAAGAKGATGATGPTGTARQIVMFGNQNQNATATNDCLAYANVGHGGQCLTIVSSFSNDPTSVEFGPIPVGGVTISQLQAITSGIATGQSVTVLDNFTPTALTCTNTAGSTCSDTTHSASIPAGDFLQVQVSGGSPNPWKVTFLLG